ncbi:MAG: peptide-methionine (R)-S-oxide reductase [Mesorhizobium sp.]|nr:MAG: peptide-methionine (R)-S-oxide reductase [Mesorhizobium sp.]
MIRRDFLWSGAAVALLAGTAAALRIGRPQDAHAAETFEVTKTEAEWRAILSDAAFNVLRKEGTEYPGTSPLLNEHRKGIFACAGCDLPLYSSDTKFDSGTGWPSFWQEIPNAVGMTADRSLGMTRTGHGLISGVLFGRAQSCTISVRRLRQPALPACG